MTLAELHLLISYEHLEIENLSSHYFQNVDTCTRQMIRLLGGRENPELTASACASSLKRGSCCVTSSPQRWARCMISSFLLRLNGCRNQRNQGSSRPLKVCTRNRRGTTLWWVWPGQHGCSIVPSKTQMPLMDHTYSIDQVIWQGPLWLPGNT